ncbi:adenylyl-sulfate kinase [Alteromonas sp. 345S023]|uniref:Adenylyl-sulfate kinase n=1 Tax=Alteromonas profundi TaxID=2696062 RepID=A0A7X5LIA9_9ALTE|nr:adenylyl-sulfate kinase [Alteromonas profundi]NDV89870.1 adenylyl-sulfate kinase [Alteromonas profundi]
MSNTAVGHVIWLTGLSGAGKSTIAEKLIALFKALNVTPVVLDGDQIRAAIQDPHWQFDEASRLRGSYIYARLASLFASQGHLVIVPTISMFEEVRQWNRRHNAGYFEVYLETSQDVRLKRDPKKLYTTHSQGKNAQMPGLDLNVELPTSPDLAIVNNGDITTANNVARQIFDTFSEQFL